jgi:hypothetical protein
MYSKVSNNPSLLKDTNNGGLINIDNSALRDYKEKKRIFQKKDKEIELLKESINSLNKDITEIKLFLNQLINKE